MSDDRPIVIVSMTTIPQRNGTLGRTLASLKAQTYRPTEVRLYAPSLVDVSYIDDDTRVIRVSDLGPVTKAYALTDPKLPPDAIVVTVDDDIVYQPDWLAVLVAGAEAYQHCAVGMSGWTIAQLVRNGQYQFVRAPGACDVLEGWAGVAYRKKFFGGANGLGLFEPGHLLFPPPEAKYVDDVWISHLLDRRGIPRRVIHAPMATDVEKKPGLHHRPDFREMNRVAAGKLFGEP